MQKQEDWLCLRHPHIKVEWNDAKSAYYCSRCVKRGHTLPHETLVRLKDLWVQESLPSLKELVAGVDDAIMDFLWKEKSGTLVNLFLYFNSEREPLNPRDFLQFWGSLSEAEQDYYMFASAEELRTEAKGE